jgi:hyperosmotically inducible periplasmic protein
MKKLLFTAMAAFMLITLSQSCKKKLSDADITTAAAEAFSKAGMSTQVTVKDGVATLTGTCKDDKCKADCETMAKGIKGVTSVVNSCTVTPPPVSLTTTLDAATQQKVKDGLKDMVGLVLQGFSGKGAIINGETNAAGKTKLMQMLASAKVLLDVASKITIK